MLRYQEHAITQITNHLLGLSPNPAAHCHAHCAASTNLSIHTHLHSRPSIPRSHCLKSTIRVFPRYLPVLEQPCRSKRTPVLKVLGVMSPSDGRHPVLPRKTSKERWVTRAGMLKVATGIARVSLCRASMYCMWFSYDVHYLV